MGSDLNFSPEFELQNFEIVKGFDHLYATWSDVLTKDDNGNYIPPRDALEMIFQAHECVISEFNLPPKNVERISTVARDYAMQMPLELEEEIREWA